MNRLHVFIQMLEVLIPFTFLESTFTSPSNIKIVITFKNMPYAKLRTGKYYL
jgi:hypothetical protein